MAEYIISNTDIKNSNEFYAKCVELGIKSRIVNKTMFLFIVFELSDEDAVALKLTFPGTFIRKFE